MEITLVQVFFALAAGVTAIVALTVLGKLHPFFALLLACLVTGLIAGMMPLDILNLMKSGMGDILSKLTLIIVLGTALGILLEKNGSTRVMADSILALVGEKRAALATALTGFVVGMPIFCDSGYVVLSGLSQSLSRRSHFTVAQTGISLAAGLYSVHCLIPPHPGATAAAATIGADYGKLIGWGILLAIPIMLSGYWWAVYSGRNNGSATGIPPSSHHHPTTNKVQEQKNPSVFFSFLPVLLPIALMATRSILHKESGDSAGLVKALNFIGEPAVALAIGLIICFLLTRNKKERMQSLSQAVEKAGGILIIIAGGAAFGAIIAATHPGEHLAREFDLSGLGWFFPFLLAALIKTAQGSSTVAIVTAASIIVPLLPALGLDSENGKLMAVLSLGVGSMLVSHTNDAYFWVIARFSDLDVRTMLRVHTAGSVWMGLTGLLMLFILSKFLL